MSMRNPTHPCAGIQDNLAELGEGDWPIAPGES